METCKTAVLLSAGMARRLYPLTSEEPKNLIKIYKDKCILDFQLKALELSGEIEDVYIIVGFQHKKIKDYISERSYKFQVHFIFNPFFEVSNNIVSVWMAMKEIPGPFITINGDDVFSENIIRKLAKENDDILLSISKSSSHYDDDDMKVILSKDGIYLEEIGKHIDVDKTVAESIGIIKFSKDGKKDFLESYHRLIEEDYSNIGSFYLSVIQTMIYEGKKVKVKTFGENEWREFDFPEDIELFSRDFKDSKLEGQVFMP